MNLEDWSDFGVACAEELARVWRDEFIRHKRNGEDLAWAAHLADLKRDRFVSKVKRDAQAGDR